MNQFKNKKEEVQTGIFTLLILVVEKLVCES